MMVTMDDAVRASETIVVTPRAVEFARQELVRRGTPAAIIRLGIKGGGCSGYSYVVRFEDDPPSDDDSVIRHGDVRFVVDKKSMVYLAGSVLDCGTGLTSTGLVLRNPHEASACGCGHSFSVRPI